MAFYKKTLVIIGLTLVFEECLCQAKSITMINEKMQYPSIPAITGSCRPKNQTDGIGRIKNMVLKTKSINKKYGNNFALNNVSLEIEKGMIYGLIGENGAGKSTFMRAIMGMITIDGGMMELFGETSEKGLRLARARMGQSIETPALYPELTAHDNLRVQAALGGIKNPPIGELLEMMAIADTGKKKVRNFSLGMRQRLSIAVTLITDPEFLVLDEPTNGLDPVGIVEMRETLKRLSSERGITILISSHLLDELSQTATHFGILHQGRLIEQHSQKDLQAKLQNKILIDVDDEDRAMRVLLEAGVKAEVVGTTSQRLEDYFLGKVGEHHD